jgi:hypothetical protein
MQIVKRTMGWLPKPSAFNYAQSLNTKRREQAKAAIASNETLAATFSSATATAAAGSVDLAIKVAVARIQAQAKAKAGG